MYVRFQNFRGGMMTSWDDLFQKAATFATEVGAQRLISISHSSDNHDGVVTVWYWDAEERPPRPVQR